MFQFFLKKLKNRVMFCLLSAYNDYVEIQRIERSRKTDVFMTEGGNTMIGYYLRSDFPFHICPETMS